MDAGPQAGEGEQLGLVEENDASGQVVELAALGRAVGIEGFEELHRRGYHHGHVPVLRGLGQADRFWSGLGVDFIGGVGVVLQHVLRPQDGSELLGGLLDDGGVGDHIDDPPQPPGPGLGQLLPHVAGKVLICGEVLFPGTAVIPMHGVQEDHTC